VEVAQREFFEQLGGVCKGMVVFARKSNKDIGTDGRPGHSGFYRPNLLLEEVTRIGAMHPLQDPIVAALQRKMKMRAEDVR